MRVYSSIDVIEALPYSRLVEDLPRLLTRAVEAPQRHIHTMTQAGGPDASLLLMPAWNASLGGIKLVNVTPGNAARSLPAVTASYLVFDTVTGEHRALLDGGELTARRTAAVAALAADRLAGKSTHRLLLIGSGRIATELAFAYRAVRDIRHVEVFSPTRSNAERLVHHLRGHGFDAEVCGDLEAGVKVADIIACATLSTEPLVLGDWLKAGQHVALIGSYTPAMREADDACMKNAVWIDGPGALSEAGDLVGPGLTLDTVRGTLRDLCEVAAIKDRDELVTVFKSVGDASQDLAAATLALGM